MPEPDHLAHPTGSADPIRWARARDVFYAVVELAPEERVAFLTTACGGDDGLRLEVESLLASDLRAGEFIEQPAPALLASSEAPSPRLKPGDVLGRYEILEFLGAGGFSEVYRALDRRLGRAIAIKLVTDPNDHDAGARLLTEAQHASSLNHPNICGVHEAENTGALPYIVLELVEGPSLADVLKCRRPSIAEVVLWARQIAAALDHAHTHGVIHRDLKCANAAVSRDGTVKILDFGLSRRIATTPAPVISPADILTNASLAGTLTHIAPEVLRGEPIDERVDLWALGVMLYEMTTGVLPFKRATTSETAKAILEARPEPLPPSIPIALRRVIERCLAKDPGSRFRTASDVKAALAAVSVDTPVHSVLRRYAAPAVITLAVAAILAALRTGSSDPATAMLVVVPFQNASGDVAQAFFADGVTEDLVAALGRVDGLRVIAPSTSLRYNNESRAATDFARAAGATHVVEGTVIKLGNEIRLSARVSDGSSGRLLWADEYRRDAREVHALHATVATDLARALRIDVNSEDTTRFAAMRSVSPDVYEAYLKGRYYWNQRTRDSILTAVTYFETAIRLDPTYAPAYASLADCYNQLGTVMVAGGSPREWRPKAAQAAIKALQIDADLGEAHATLGYVRHYDWQWTEAEKSFRRAIALNPSYPLARIWYANLLCSLRRFDEAVEQALLARDLDPISLIVSTNVGWVFHRARRDPEAIAEYERGLAMDPTYLQAHMRLRDALASVGRFDEALRESETIVRLSQGNPVERMMLEVTKLRAGQPNEFDRRLNDVSASSSNGYASPAVFANAYFYAGRMDEGFVWLERSYRERTNNIAYLAVEPVYDGVRNDPRFTAIIHAIGLP